MRLVKILKDEAQAEKFSLYLDEKGVENKLEKHPPEFSIWIINEDHLPKAEEIFQSFLKEPDFIPKKKFEDQNTNLSKSLDPNEKKEANNKIEEIKNTGYEPESNRAIKHKRWGTITVIVSAICIILYFLAWNNEPKNLDQNRAKYYLGKLIDAPYKYFLYEYPLAYQYAENYSKAALNSQDHNLFLKSQEGFSLNYKIQKTPYWHGYYETYLVPPQSVPALNYSFLPNPTFDQIKTGQVWRLLTPIFLHGSFFHILFNLMWFLFLGHQMERKIGAFKFSLFILISGIISNTAQYLITGPNFLGISGVLFAMAGFIWIREKKAPWEGYTVQKSTLYFLAFYLVALLLLQGASFILEISGRSSIAPNIGNTAHLSGAILGLILGNFNYFSAWRHSKH